MTAPDVAHRCVERAVAYWTYANSGGCARCASRVADRFVSTPGHVDGCDVKALTLADAREDWAEVDRLLRIL
jgi:hypothetical protein